MKKREIKPALNALRTVKMPKIEDKDLRNALIKNHLFLLGQGKKYDAAIEDLRVAHLGPYDAELKEVQEMQNQLNQESDAAKRKELVEKINSHTDLLEAINGFNKAINDLDNEEVDVPSIDGEKFAEEYGKQDYDCGVIEALFPMFK